MVTNSFKRITALLLAVFMIFGSANIVRADVKEGFANINELGIETTEPSEELVSDFKLSKSIAVTGSEIKGRIKNLSSEHSEVYIGYVKPDKEVVDIPLVLNEDSGNYEFSYNPEQIGYWTLAYVSIDGVKYLGTDFYGSFKVVSDISEVFPEQSYPYLDASNLSDGITIKQSDVMNALGQVRFYDNSGNAVYVNAKITGDTGTYNYNVVNDGLSITATTDFDGLPAVGNYTAVFESEGKTVEKQITVVDDFSQADYVHLSALPIVDAEYPDEVSLSAVQLSDVGTAIRLAGSNRFMTAIQISSGNFDSAKKAVLVNAYNFPDALAGVSYASAIEGPILFASEDEIGDNTLAELKRLGVKEVVIIGGKNSVSGKVANKLIDNGIAARRISSNNRYSTALEIAKKLSELKKYNKAIVVNAYDHPDALSAGAYSGKMGYPIIYTDPSGIGDYTVNTLKSYGVKEIIIVGGTNSVSDAVKTKIENMGLKVVRIGGKNRYETSLNFANKFYPNPKTITIANGQDFPDALAGGPVAAANNAPLLLTPPNSLNSGIQAIMEKGDTISAIIFGGNNSVAQEILANVKDIVQLNSSKIVEENKPPSKNPEPQEKPKPGDDAKTPDKKKEVPKVPVLHIEKRVPTADRPIRILLDQGHGVNYNKGIVEGYFEGTAMYWYGLILKNELEKYGFDVKTTRNDIEAEERSLIGSKYSSTNGISLQQRGAMGEGYDLLLSLHTNALAWNTPNYQKARGTEIFDSTTSPRKDLAEKLCTMIAEHFGHTNRGVKYKFDEDGSGANWYGVLRHSKATHSMLVEHGFHTNEDDCTLLMDREFKIEMAQKTAKLLAEYYGMPVK
ncbi:cell wall-binding repeat-containing protein [Microaceticoccus formicicus]|uniref:cell wall-binding repeat-containing protein n=1 Tax=Microaceticoccus formicicus TaxID=3118105 RepID=UPI003CD02A29|nr:cell wall-binding repeat-containing protein [Peptoniphilaceae bacterium AMB_02]